MLAPLTKGYITQQFRGSAHYGIDIGWTSLGVRDPEITAWDDGIVVASYFMTNGGNTIAIRHEGVTWYQTRYCHLKSRSVVVGQRVSAGQVIGIGGNTGVSTGPHLHFEVLAIPTGYTAFSYTDRVRYAIDPLAVTFFSQVTGTGVQSMTEITDKLPLAIPLFSNVRIRSTPAILTNNVVGLVPLSGLRYLGETKEVINGHKWAKLLHDGKVVWAALNLLEVKLQEVIKVVEVEKPLNMTLSQDGVSVTIIKEVVK